MWAIKSILYMVWSVIAFGKQFAVQDKWASVECRLPHRRGRKAQRLTQTTNASGVAAQPSYECQPIDSSNSAVLVKWNFSLQV